MKWNDVFSELQVIFYITDNLYGQGLCVVAVMNSDPDTLKPTDSVTTKLKDQRSNLIPTSLNR
jgi:hypothetical protein